METSITKSTHQNLTDTDKNDFFQDKAYNSGMRALMSVRNFSNDLAKDYAQLLKLEKDLDIMNDGATLMIEKCSTIQALETWRDGITQIHLTIIAINQLLTTAAEKASAKSSDSSGELWNQFDTHLSHLTAVYNNLNDTALAALPATEHQQWSNNIFNLNDSALPIFVSHAELCRLKLQMLEKYTSDELVSITKMIQDHIPDDFSFEEAAKYHKEYLIAMVDFTKEFREKKNLWDKFLDVLAGGTHQPPSERVMLDSWINGEKIEP